jgi:protein TonB
MATTPIKPLLFRPAPRWHLWAALGGALAIHLTAVALAQKREVVAVELPPQAPPVVEATLMPPEATPPPEDIPVPEPPPPPEIKPEFIEERTPPPRPPPTAQKFTPIKSSEMSMSRAKALAINAPRPQYPYEARSRRIMGSGVCVVEVDPGSGNVTSASMTQSIGNPILDNAAVTAFRQWRFRPGTVSKVRIPITFTMTGSSY